MSHDVQPTVCPTCDNNKLRQVQEDWAGRHKGQTYTVKALEFYVCPVCDEKIYPPSAMRRIQEASPAFPSRPQTRRTPGRLQPAIVGADS